ncbi:uncharacterized protein [Phaseolus vulgaris]|uniref:uncharacterized protein isoform X2 n=2 Tax=Phaseolus vulgaris TaxID=3885 RepID=UPI0035CB8205
MFRMNFFLLWVSCTDLLWVSCGSLLFLQFLQQPVVEVEWIFKHQVSAPTGSGSRMGFSFISTMFKHQVSAATGSGSGMDFQAPSFFSNR